MKRAMTTKKALKITAERYRWLAENPKAHPADWPGWEDYGIEVGTHSKDKDPLCQAAGGSCMDCPLIALWIKGSGHLPTNQRLKSCLVRTSPYMVRDSLRYSFKLEERDKSVEAATTVFTEAEYALKNGIREPDLSIYQAKRVERAPRASRRARTGRIKPTGRVRRGV